MVTVKRQCFVIDAVVNAELVRPRVSTLLVFGRESQW